MSRKPKNQAINSDEFNLEFIGTKEESPEERTVTSRRKLRERLQDDMLNFLKMGGHVEQVPDHVKTDVPKKPVSNYGSRPI